jgi:hypothetical protein
MIDKDDNENIETKIAGYSKAQKVCCWNKLRK